MTKRMLIDATHAEETRVVVLDGNRLEDFDVETSTKKQLKGNIYLARVVRVEPSLQAAFVEYGGGRHGFLAFSEIHPDYYQIPVADRERLLALQAAEAEEEEEEEDEAGAEARAPAAEALPDTPPASWEEPGPDAAAAEAPAAPEEEAGTDTPALPLAIAEAFISTPEPADPPAGEALPMEETDAAEPEAPATETLQVADDDLEPPPPETLGGEADGAEGGEGADEAHARRTARFLRNYRIQEVIKRRQIMLVQVVKEERGTKGAALTTYISLAGRFCVLMPNSPRGGGVSRKITSAADRKRLREIISELEIPRGMGLIVRTAGANRPKPEIRRDCEYLMRLWDDIREHTLRSVAPSLIYEEASLIKRSIRDVYSRDIDEIIVDGEAGWHAAHDFMRMLMPAHARKVVLWRDPGQSLFVHHQVEAQLDAMLQPTVQLRSGGYLVINQTEALVAIDVNSGRATRERSIEETALRTNLEASDEVARQLRLRDLAGLIVIDYIDMESKKNNAAVEHRLKEALKVDRARIQVGHISHFGLMEMSRQRLRPSLAETSFVPCPRCGGLGHIRSVESSALHVLRAIEEEGAKGRASLIEVRVANAVIIYILNHKRERLSEIEARDAIQVQFAADDSLIPPEIQIERLRAQTAPAERPSPVVVPIAPGPVTEEAESESTAEPDLETEDESAQAAEPAPAPAHEEAEGHEKSGRRRRRGRRGRRGERATPTAPETAPSEAAALEQGALTLEPPAESAEPPTPAPAPAEAELAPPLFSDQPDIPPGAFPVLPREPSPPPLPAELPPAETAAEPAAVTEPAETPPPEAAEKATPRRRTRRSTGVRKRKQPEADGAPKAAAEVPPVQPDAPAAETPAAAEVPPAQPETVEPAPLPLAVAPEAALPAEPAPQPEPEPEPAPPAEPSVGLAVAPIVIGKDPIPEAAPKRGWWRR